MSPPASVPLLSARDARVEEAGAVLADGLSFETPGGSVAIVGDFAVLFGTLFGRAQLTRGALDVLGVPATVALAQNQVGFALTDPPLPKSSTVLEYLVTSARLLGLGSRAATERALACLDALGLGTLRNRLVATLGPVERRSTALARAMLGGAPVVAVENPLRAGGDVAAATLAGVLDRAMVLHRLIVGLHSPPAVGPTADLLSRMDHVVVLAGGKVVAEGPPSRMLGGNRYCHVSVTRAAGALAALLRERGAVVTPLMSPREKGAEHADEAGRFFVALPEGAEANLVVDAALAARAPVIELVPLGFDWNARKAPAPPLP